MDNTRFSSIAELLGEFYIDNRDVEEYEELFYLCDLGFAYAIGYTENHLTLNPSGQALVNQTWEAFCDVVGLDYYADFDSYDDMMEFLSE